MILVIDIVLKLILTTFCYIHRKVQLSAIIKETLCWNRWQLTQRPRTGQGIETETPEWSALNGHKILRGKGGGWLEGNNVSYTQFSKHTYEFTVAVTACARSVKPQVR